VCDDESPVQTGKPEAKRSVLLLKPWKIRKTTSAYRGNYMIGWIPAERKVQANQIFVPIIVSRL
jgi:hypothetical protein